MRLLRMGYRRRSQAADVRFAPESGHKLDIGSCPLSAKSGHGRRNTPEISKHNFHTGHAQGLFVGPAECSATAP